MSHPKKSGQGFLERLQLVERHFGPVFDDLRRSVPRRAATDDDILDALAALWTAERVLKGTAIVLPAEPKRDAYGLPMEMVA
jgi:predicted RNase H-like nuclease